MARGLTSGVVTASGAPAVNLALLVEAEFSEGPIRMWTGIGAFVWGGKTFEGVGQFLGLSGVEETVQLAATGVTLSLSAIPSALVSLAYGQYVQGRPARVWLAFFSDAVELIADPVLIFAGRMDAVGDEDDGASATITVRAESNLADLKRINEQRLTDADHQRRFPGDKSLRFVKDLQNKPVIWGKPDPSPSTSRGSGGGMIAGGILRAARTKLDI